MKKKLLIGALALSIFNTANAEVRYGTFNCPGWGYKSANTFDYDDQKYNSRWFYTGMTLFKKRQPKNPNSDYYPVYYDSHYQKTGFNCPDEQKTRNLCMYSSSWQAFVKTSAWDNMSDFLPNRIDGEHYWRKPGQTAVEYRKSKLMWCMNGGLDWETGQYDPHDKNHD